MDYNTLKNNEEQLKNEVNSIKARLDEAKEQYSKYENIDERLSNGEVIDQDVLDASYALADEVDDLKRAYNKQLNLLNGTIKQIELVKATDTKNTDDFLANKYTVVMSDATNEIESIKAKLENNEISEYDAELAIAKAQATYDIASKHYNEFLERKENQSNMLDSYAESVIEKNTVGKASAKYFEGVFSEEENAKKLDEIEYKNAGKIKEVEERAKEERARKEFEGTFVEEKIGQYVDLMDAKDLIEKLRKNGMSMDEIEKFVFNQKAAAAKDKATEVKEDEDKELESQIFSDDDNKQVKATEDEKAEVQEFDPMKRNDFTAEEVSEKEEGQTNEEEFDPMKRNTDAETIGVDLESEEAKKAAESLTPEEGKKPTKISTASKGLMNKIGTFTKNHKIGLIGIAASVALVMANPALAAAVGLAGVGYEAVKKVNEGRKA